MRNDKLNKKSILELSKKVNEIQKERYKIIKEYQNKLLELKTEYSNDLSYQKVYDELNENEKEHFSNDIRVFIEIIFETILESEGIK